MPEVPTGDGSIGPPGFGEFQELIFLWPLLQVVGLFDGALQAEVIDRPDIGAVEDEHEEHFGGPAADAVDGGEAFDHFFVRQL